MEIPKIEGIEILRFLFAGLLAAWVYYGLSGAKKPDASERIVQALIFTVFIKAAVGFEKELALLVGRVVSVGHWSELAESFWTVVSAFALGIISAHAKFRAWLFGWLRKRKLTKLSGHFGEWRRAFDDGERYVVLQMKDGRRLYGYPREFPVDPESGHFRMETAAWLPRSESERAIELSGVKFVVVPAADVRWVEFMPTDEEDTNVKLRGPTEPSDPVAATAGANTQGRGQSSNGAGAPAAAAATTAAD